METGVVGWINLEDQTLPEKNYKGLVIREAGLGRKIIKSVLHRELQRANLSPLQGRPDPARQIEKEPKVTMRFWVMDVKTQ